MGNILKLDKTCINRKVLRSLRKIMEDDYYEVLQTFLDESLSYYTQIHESFAVEDFDSLKSVSPLFRDACLSVGAERLAELSEKMTTLCRSGHYHDIEDLIEEIDVLYEMTRLAIQKEQKRCNKLAS